MTTGRWTAILLALWGGLGQATESFSAPGRRLAMWVWTDEISDVVRRDALLDRASQSCINVLYVSVYRGTPNSDGDLMYERAHLGALLGRAHAMGIEVRIWTAYGDPSWPTLCVNPDATCSCKSSCWVWDRIAEYNRFNADPRFEQFDGWMFDVEPVSADALLLGLYGCARQRLDPASPLGAAIRFFWHDPVEYPCGSGQVAPFYQHVIGTLNLDLVVVMCYRDFAVGVDGIVDLCEEEALYAAQVGRTDRLEVGLETAPASPEKITFFEEGERAMQCAITEVERRLPVGGFGINYYQHSMLEGNSLWPAVDPWACEVEALTVTSFCQ